MRRLCPAVLVLLSAAGLSACVPASSPGGGPQVAQRAQPLGAGAFPEPLRGWSASAPSTGSGQGGGTVARRTYQDPSGRTVEVVWYLDNPSLAAAVTGRANTETGDSGLAMVLAPGDETIEVATDPRTVLHLDGTAGLGAQMSYFAAIIGAAPPSS
jgi:hypothetical protein